MPRVIDKPRIRAAMAAAGLHLDPRDPLPAQLLATTDRLKLPRPALLAWVNDRPCHPFTQRHFFHWLLRYKLTSAAALEDTTLPGHFSNAPELQLTPHA